MTPEQRFAKLHGLIAHWSGMSGIEQALIEGRALLEAGLDIHAEPDDQGNYWKLLHQAAYQGSAAFCQLLLEFGARPNDMYGGTTALHEAANYGGVEACRVLVAGGADPNYVSPHAGSTYLTPFQEVVKGTTYDHAEMIRLFVMEFGCDVHQRTLDGRSLLDLVPNQPDIQTLLRVLATEQAVSLAIGKANANEQSGPSSSAKPARSGMSPL